MHRKELDIMSEDANKKIKELIKEVPAQKEAAKLWEERAKTVEGADKQLADKCRKVGKSLEEVHTHIEKKTDPKQGG